MNNGWIKLHRKVLDNPISKKPAWLSLWVTLLLLANHDEQNSFIWNGERIVLKQGEFVTGRKSLKDQTGIPESTIEDILSYLETQQQIRQHKTTKYRLITILKWKEYQTSDSNSDSKATTKQQQSDTINNAKNVRMKEESQGDVPSQEIKTFIDSFKEINPSHERLFRNTTERSSAERLLKKYGLSKMLATVENLPEIISKPYAPRITTPYELEKNLGKLLIFVEQNKNIIKTKQPNVIFS